MIRLPHHYLHEPCGCHVTRQCHTCHKEECHDTTCNMTTINLRTTNAYCQH